VTTYAASGVDIDAGNRAVALMRRAVQSTYGPEVLAGLGTFGGLYDASGLQRLREPVLVASTDGVGTKVRLAAQAGRYRGIGHDIVNHCANDILVQGARPLFFLDYIASARLDPDQVAIIVGGMSEACRALGCALLGGETAEMPGVYAPAEFDVVGTIIGVVERSASLPRVGLGAGDVLVGLASTGAHTNGYSLIRRIFSGMSLDVILPELGLPLGEALLAPHRSYRPLVKGALDQPESPVKALVHVTGGGFLENIPRVLPDAVSARIRLGTWPVPPLFSVLQERGQVPVDEMFRVFNMGIGMIALVGPEAVAGFQASLGEPSWVIGELVAGGRGVRLE
jgi:phosphoribosylformylglycinamidine cyclo-ligase/phosphoribosylamine--glycine ligase/phosphoribosylformylglycinamidine cyclo-ligase